MLKRIISLLLGLIIWGVFGTKVYAVEKTVPIIEDTYIKSGYIDQKLWNESNFFIGYDKEFLGHRTRAYIKIDTLALRTLIQNDSSKIISAKLRVFQYSHQAQSHYIVKVLEISQPWAETEVSWKVQPIIGNLITYATINNENSWKEVDLTDWLKDVINGETNDYGFALVAQDETALGGTFFSTNCLNGISLPSCNNDEQPHVLLEYDANLAPIPGKLVKPIEDFSTNIHNINFEWTDSSDPNNDPIHTSLQLSLNPDFSQLIIDQDIDHLNSYTIELNDHATYYARIQYSDDIFSSYSNTVEIEIYNSVPNAGNIIYPQNGTTLSEKQINFEWESGNDNENDVLTYTLLVSASESFEDYSVIQNIETMTRYVTTLDYGTYYAKLRYFDNYEASFSPTIQFKIQPIPIVSPKKENPITNLTSSTSSAQLPNTPEITLIKVEKDNIELKIKSQVNSELFLNISGNIQTPIEIKAEISTITIHYQFIPGIEYQLYGYIKNKSGIYSSNSNTVKIYIPLISELGIGTGDEKEASTKIGNGKCNINIHTEKNTISKLDCNIPAPIFNKIHAQQNKDPKYIDLYLNGIMFEDIEITVNYLRCKQYPWYVPKFLRKCRNETFEKETIKLKSPRRSLRLFNSKTNEIEWGFVSFGPSTGSNKYQYQHLLKTESKASGLQIANFILIEFKPSKWDNWLSYYVISNKSDIFKLPEVKPEPTHEQKYSKYFDFVLDHFPQVTQWHGDTAYRKDHSGIDFGVKLQKVFAPADGIVRYSQWNEYDGKCYQGGNTIRIEHPNGMHSVFFHLENYTNNLGNDTKVGDIVKKGDLIGTSGNTGYYNCKSFGYHLHFELRKSKDRSTHVNPVPYVNTDWTQIKTVPNNKNALTGDNPHPTY